MRRRKAVGVPELELEHPPSLLLHSCPFAVTTVELTSRLSEISPPPVRHILELERPVAAQGEGWLPGGVYARCNVGTSRRTRGVSKLTGQPVSETSVSSNKGLGIHLI